MNIHTNTNSEQWQALWETFSSKENLWEDWELTKTSITKKENVQFIVLEEQEKILGLVPLQYDEHHKKWYLLGNLYSENRTLWIPQEHLLLVLEKLPTPYKLIDIAKEQIEREAAIKKYIQGTDKRFFINLKQHEHNLEKHFATLSKKHRHNLFYDLRKLEEQGYECTWDKKAHIELLIQFNKERFKEESDYADETFVQEAKQFFTTLEQKELLHTLIIKKEGKAVGIEIAALHNNHYYVLNGGHDYNHKNIGKKLIMEHIKQANEKKADLIDFLVGDTGWKELWNLEQETVYTIINKK